MPKDTTEQILKAITKLEGSINERINGLEQRLSTLEQGNRLTPTEINIKMDKLMDMLALLIQKKDVVIRQDAPRYILDKAKVYRALDARGLNRKAAMRVLYKGGVLERDHAGKNTVPTWVGGTCKRTVIINM